MQLALQTDQPAPALVGELRELGERGEELLGRAFCAASLNRMRRSDAVEQVELAAVDTSAKTQWIRDMDVAQEPLSPSQAKYLYAFLGRMLIEEVEAAGAVGLGGVVNIDAACLQHVIYGLESQGAGCGTLAQLMAALPTGGSDRVLVSRLAHKLPVRWRQWARNVELTSLSAAVVLSSKEQVWEGAAILKDIFGMLSGSKEADEGGISWAKQCRENLHLQVVKLGCPVDGGNFRVSGVRNACRAPARALLELSDDQAERVEVMVAAKAAELGCSRSVFGKLDLSVPRQEAAARQAWLVQPDLVPSDTLVLETWLVEVQQQRVAQKGLTAKQQRFVAGYLRSAATSVLQSQSPILM